MMQVKIEKFEGPLALLLRIIEKEELDITEISLSKIADEYLVYIRKPENNINSEDMADFLVVAAKLLLIKSRALLPYIFPEEEQEIEEFENQLKLYKEFVDIAKKIEKMIGKKKFMFTREFNRQAVLSSMKVFSPPKNIGVTEIGEIFSEIIGRIQPPEKLEEKVLERKIHIEEKIAYIQNMITEKIQISFNKILSGATTKTEIIVSFLALLELVKQRSVVAAQDDLFTEIVICRAESEQNIL